MVLVLRSIIWAARPRKQKIKIKKLSRNFEALFLKNDVFKRWRAVRAPSLHQRRIGGLPLMEPQWIIYHWKALIKGFPTVCLTPIGGYDNFHRFLRAQSYIVSYCGFSCEGQWVNRCANHLLVLLLLALAYSKRLTIWGYRAADEISSQTRPLSDT